ncbi:mitochondrial fission protein ELM1-like [Gastrolobium bilobum]|uniref:mitochondrial fission protein ELM1-like n=1 Tax=Gastrolobium bilobum TaxID=150636 RepID=UPI002AB27CCF|nr:mitochondrial fission protein ELM1-like [Gastrolobium bilobum]
MKAMPEILDGAIRRAVVIGNGFAGAENQCIGLVRALGLSNRHSLYRVTRPRGGINRWLRWLPVSLHKKIEYVIRKLCGNSRFQTSKGISDVLEADAHHIATVARETFRKDGPLLVVASGRDTISVASSIKRLAPENVFLVQIQHPRWHLSRFDLVITPRHDYYPLTPHAQQQIPWFLRRWVTPWEPPGRNVVLTVGALHQADSTALRVAASAWHDELATLPKPLLVVNVGGPTGKVVNPPIEALAMELKAQIIIKMSSFNPLATILSQKPMDGTNYKQWKTNLDIVLQFEKLNFVLTTPIPAQPAEDAPEATKAQFQHEKEKANVAVRCYILASLASHLQEQVNMIKSGAAMLQTLDGMFATSSSSAR